MSTMDFTVRPAGEGATAIHLVHEYLRAEQD
jgi:hypothetical protein